MRTCSRFCCFLHIFHEQKKRYETAYPACDVVMASHHSLAQDRVKPDTVQCNSVQLPQDLPAYLPTYPMPYTLPKPNLTYPNLTYPNLTYPTLTYLTYLPT